jgi:preprotein translocase subunit SecG
MTSLLLARVDFVHYLFAIPMALLSIFLILVILVQRGRGGGLTGALGGMGGQSAFGTKAGDLFTRITIVVAAIWVLLAMASIKVLAQRTPFENTRGRSVTPPTAPAVPGTGTTAPKPSAAPTGATPEATPPANTTPPASTTPAPSTAPPTSGAPAPATPAEKTQP